MTRLLLAALLAAAVVAGAIGIAVALGVSPFWPLAAAGAAASLGLAIRNSRLSRAALRDFHFRGCTGRHWKRRFPQSKAAAIRQFLELITASRSLPLRPLQLHPDDRLLDLSRVVYPMAGLPDGCELEGLAMSLKRHYGRDLAQLWRDDLTLEEIYAYANGS